MCRLAMPMLTLAVSIVAASAVTVPEGMPERREAGRTFTAGVDERPGTDEELIDLDVHAPLSCVTSQLTLDDTPQPGVEWPQLGLGFCRRGAGRHQK
ncbi:MAG: hypothetical protein IV100_19545 [Myxococcales bacterium]|nr:hypothetical protein [Myxococcales bacterium]